MPRDSFPVFPFVIIIILFGGILFTIYIDTKPQVVNPQEVVDTILRCVREGDSYDAKQYMTQGILNKDFGLRVNVIDVLQEIVVENQSRYGYECLQNQISGSTAIIFYRVYSSDWYLMDDGSRCRSIYNVKFTLRKVSSREGNLPNSSSNLGSSSNSPNSTIEDVDTSRGRPFFVYVETRTISPNSGPPFKWLLDDINYEKDTLYSNDRVD